MAGQPAAPRRRRPGGGVRKLTGMLLLAAVLLSLAAVRWPHPAGYIWRLIRWGDADPNDHERFPRRDLERSPRPFFFRVAHDPSGVREAFRRAAGIEDLDAFLAATGTLAFIVIPQDAIRYEQYYNGARRDSVVTSFSMAKSVASALVGKAIAEGHIAGVDDAITRYLPELAARDARFASITIRDLLMMSSGIQYREGFMGDDAATYYYPDLRHLALRHTASPDIPASVSSTITFTRCCWA